MNHVLEHLHKLPIPRTASESTAYMYTHSLLAICIAVISLIMLGVCITLWIKGKNEDLRNISGLGVVIIVLANCAFIMTNITTYTHPMISYSEYNSYDINSALLTSDSKVLDIDNTNGEFANTDTNMNLIYTPSGNQSGDITIAHFNRKTFKPINKQGRQYVKLMNAFEDITHYKHYSLVTIKDDKNYNLRMDFQYQDKVYKLSFDNKSNQIRTIILQ